MKVVVGIMGLAVGFLVTAAVAIPVTEEFATTAGWTVIEDTTHGNEGTPEGSAFGVASLDSLGNPTPALKITATGQVADYETDKIRIASGTDFLGNYTGGVGAPGTISSQVQGIYFDFYIDTTTMAEAPAQLGIYFIGGTHETHEWYWDLTSSLVYNSEWNQYGANMDGMSPDSGFGTWYDMSGNGSWGDDIADVTEIGIVLGYLYNDPGTQVIAIDNFTIQEDPFLVPEPETYAFLAMAVLALGLVFRQRVNESMQMMMARIRI